MVRSLWTVQPFKAAYLAVFFITTPPYLLSLSILYSLVRSRRPIAHWTLKQCLACAYVKSWFHALAVTRHQGGFQLRESKQAKGRLVVIEPPSNDYFLGVTTPGAAKPSAIRALWSPTAIKPGTGSDLGTQKVVLHFPGGAFVLPLATNGAGESVSKLITEHFGGASTCFIEYRLSKDSETRFPAALQDFITAYSYVLKLGVDPKRIILSGDSAGGNLVLAGLRYLETSQSLLPLPGGVMTYSPAVEITPDLFCIYEGYRNSVEDILTPSLLQWATEMYLPKGDAAYEAEATPFLSPLHNPFATKVPIFLEAGMEEAFHDGIKAFSQEMSQVQGNRIRFHHTELAPHDIFLCHELIGFKAEVEAAVRYARDFFEQAS